MNFLNVLFTEDDYDRLFVFLKKAFGQHVTEVQVDTIIDDSYVILRWNGSLDPNELAATLTEEIPSVLVECPSNTGIDVFSRYFNKKQLW